MARIATITVRLVFATIAACLAFGVSVAYADGVTPSDAENYSALFSQPTKVPLQDASVPSAFAGPDITLTGLEELTWHTKGQFHPCYGTITASSNITSATCAVYNVDGNFVTGATRSPNATSVQIVKAFDADLHFADLPVGVFVYRISATAGGVTKVLSERMFCVVDSQRTVADGLYNIKSIAHANYGLAAAGTSRGANVSAVPFTGKSNLEKFYVTYDKDGYYRIELAADRTKRLDVSGAGSANGTNIQVYDPGDGPAQRFYIVPTGKGDYFIMPGCGAGRTLDISGSDAAQGANVQIWDNSMETDRRFTFAPTTLYSPTPIYAITWVGDGGNTLRTDTVKQGTTPSYTGAMPTKASTAQYTYTFSGWSPSVAKATKDATYTAQFKSSVRSYTVTFTDGMGKTLKTQKVAYGSSAAAPSNPTRSGYAFLGWDKSFAKVMGNLTVNATWKTNQATTAKSIAKADVMGITNKVYTGSAITQKPVVKLGGKTLKEGTDYTVSYANNTKIGTATVTIVGKGDYTGSVKKTFKITKVAVSGVVLDKTSLSLEVGSSASLKATVSPSNATNKNVTWKSSDAKIATVDSKGTVKAVAAGKVTITATADGKSATCSVTVTKKPEVVSPSADGTSTEAEVVSGSGINWKRLWGNSQFDTMRKIVAEGWKSGCGGTVIIATASGYWDALSASGVAGLFGAPVLITDKNKLTAQTKAELQRINPARIIIVGGPKAITEAVKKAIQSACPKAKVERTYGQSATDTAAEFNKKYFGKKADTCILATSKGFQDALSAAPVAYAKCYPVFLVDGKNSISRRTLDAMKACGIKRVIVVGGTAVISNDIVSRLKAIGVPLWARLWGKSAYDTSNAIAKWGIAHGMKAERTGVCTGKRYYDALCGAALCGRLNTVLVLVDDGKTVCITDYVKKHCQGIRIGYVFGGVHAVPAWLYDALLVITKCAVSNQNADIVAKQTINNKKTINKTTSNYDVTGDGIPDKVNVKVAWNSSGATMTVAINNKTALTLPKGGMNFVDYVWVRVLRLKNGVPFLYVRNLGSYASGTEGIYQYKNGKLVQVANGFLGLSVGASGGHFSEVTAKDNSIRTKGYVATASLGTLEHYRTFGYSKGKLNTEFGRISYSGSSYFVASKAISSYSDHKKTKFMGTIPKGTRLYIKACWHYKGKMFGLVSHTLSSNGSTEFGWIDLSEPVFTNGAKAAWGEISVY